MHHKQQDHEERFATMDPDTTFNEFIDFVCEDNFQEAKHR